LKSTNRTLPAFFFRQKSLLPCSRPAVNTGIFQQIFANQYGSDNVVATTVSLLPDSETALFSMTCNPAAAGIFTQIFTNQNGCVRTVTTTVALLPGSETFLSSTTCDAAQAGLPNDPAHGWFAEVEFVDGKTELLEGDVALLL
jgi:hypothetical protein